MCRCCPDARCCTIDLISLTLRVACWPTVFNWNVADHMYFLSQSFHLSTELAGISSMERDPLVQEFLGVINKITDILINRVQVRFFALVVPCSSPNLHLEKLGYIAGFNDKYPICFFSQFIRIQLTSPL